MAKILVEKPDGLVGNEIRFLRKHAGLSGQELAALLDDVTPEQVSRVENDRPGDKLGASGDRLVRAMACETDPARTALKRLAAAKLAASMQEKQVVSWRSHLVGGRVWKARADKQVA